MHKYPHLCVLLASFVIAYSLYHLGYLHFLDGLSGFGYISIFIGGLLFSFGFTTPFGIAIFIEMAQFTHPVLGALVAGAGALLSDYLIFDLLRFSLFTKEIKQLRSSHFFRSIGSHIHSEKFSEPVRRMLLWLAAGFVIASPLPDELGVTMLSGISKMSSRDFAMVSFGCNTLGVFLIMVGARAIA